MKLSLRSRFLIPSVILIIAALAISGISSYRLSSKAMLNSAKNELQNEAVYMARGIGGLLAEFDDIVMVWSKLDTFRIVAEGTSAEETSRSEANSELIQYTKKNNFIDSSLISNMNGDIVAASDVSYIGTISIADREYFKKAAEGKTVHSRIILNKATGLPTFVIATAVYSGKKVVGVLSVAVNMKNLTREFVTKIGQTDRDYAYMINGDGLIVAHTDPNVVMKTNVTDHDFGKKLMQLERGGIEYEFNGKERIVSVSLIPGTNWRLCISKEAELVYAPLEALAYSSAIISAIAIVLLIIAISWLSGSLIIKPVKVIAGAAKAIASGNGGQAEVPSDSLFKAELLDLHIAIKDMLAALQSNISQAQEHAKQAEIETNKAHEATQMAEEAMKKAENAKREGMLHAASQLQGIVEIISTASEEISAQTEQASRGAEMQTQRSGETATAMEEMTATVLEVAKSADQAAHTADDAKTNAQSGATTVAELIKGVQAVGQQSSKLQHDMGELDHGAEKIGSIMEVISDIADQTNLLALNAAIEAARAGDAGRGFAVVADEVRKLAEKTMTATKEVAEAINSIQTSTVKSVADAEKSMEAVDRCAKLAQESGQALERIVDIVESTSGQVTAIAAASEEQAASTDEVGRIVEDISHVSNDTAEAMRQAREEIGDLASKAGQLESLISEMKA